MARCPCCIPKEVMGCKDMAEPRKWKWKEISLTIQEAELNRLSVILEMLLKYISRSETTLVEKSKRPL